MPSFRQSVIALALALVASATALPAQSVAPADVHARMIGRWVGALEYKDYANPDRRVTLPTLLEISARAAGGVTIHSIFDDGPGKTVTSDDRFVLAADGASLDWTGEQDEAPSVFRVASLQRDSTGALRFVAEREGEDDDKPATLRETVTIAADSLAVLKEVRFAGEGFTFRHVFNLKRER